MHDASAHFTVRCQQLTANGKPLEAATVELPAPDGDQVLIEIDHCGVCHSDLHLQDGYFDLGDGHQLDVSAQRTLPLTLGHEIAGRVAAVGPDAPRELAGAKVAVYPWIGCGQCKLCERGDEHLCDRPRVIGINVDGGFASHVLVPHSRYVISLDGVPGDNAGCLMCSGLTAFSAMRKAERFLAAGPLAIVGIGGVGMMALRFARALELGPVVAIDTSAAAREAALEMGAIAAIDPTDEDARKVVKSATGGGAGAIVDFVGSGQSLTFAQRIAAKGGGIIVVGLMGGRFTTPVPLLPFTALTIQGSYVGSLANAHDMLDIVKSGAVDDIPVVTRALDEANAALDDLRNRKVVGRTVLRP